MDIQDKLEKYVSRKSYLSYLFLYKKVKTNMCVICMNRSCGESRRSKHDKKLSWSRK